MKEQSHRTDRLRVCTHVDEIDAFLVVADGSQPDAVPVIPTQMAEAYWSHPSHRDTAAAS
jgi:hypothetical protein